MRRLHLLLASPIPSGKLAEHIMDVYGHAFAKILFPAWESGLRRRSTLRHLAFLERSQWLPLSDLEAHQTAKLHCLMRHAYTNVPYYRRVFLDLGIGPEAIRDVSDLAKLPMLGRDKARDTVVERTATAGAKVEVHKQTSGTMGKPLVFGYERESDYWRFAMKMRGYSWAGYRVGQRSLHYWGAGPPTANQHASLATRLKKAKVRLDRFLRREHYMDCGRRGSDELNAVVDAIRRERPEVVVCYAQAGADLARHIVEHQLRDWPAIPVICGAESLSSSDRAIVEQAFGPAVFETYGCREVMLMATECPSHAGLHVSMETLVVEVVVRDPSGSERPARPGEIGEVVITDLTNHAMPFIRYANGDLAVPAEPGVCACGRAHPRLARVEGRAAETLLDATGARVNGLVFNVVIAHLAHAIRQFQAVQHRDRSITLKLVPSASFNGQIESALRVTWEKYLPGIPVHLELVSDIPVSATGKRQVVIVERS